MSDIIERASQVLAETDCGKPLHQAQALADAGLLADPARTVPTRAEIVETVSDIDAESWPNPASTEEIADAILALLADQPTVAEVKARALEEAAELLDQPRALWFEFGIGVTVQDDTNRDVELTTWLRERAQQHRDGK